MDKFYKLARPDGWDFYTGNTINYRDKIGKIARRPETGIVRLCSNTCLHASRNPNQALIAAKIPCSVYFVEGIPIKEDKNKAGFKQFLVLEELNPEKVFEWKYKEACNSSYPFKIKPPKITTIQIELVKDWASTRALVGDLAWDSVRASVGDSVRASVGDLIWDSVWASIGGSIWNSVCDSVRGSIWNLVWAYLGWIFSPCIKKWKYIDHKKGIYPFQSAVDLWMRGLVPSFDGKLWRLHGGENGKILWEGKIN